MGGFYGSIHCKKVCLGSYCRNGDICFLKCLTLNLYLFNFFIYIMLNLSPGTCTWREVLKRWCHFLNGRIDGTDVSDHLFNCGRSLRNAVTLVFDHSFKWLNIRCNFIYGTGSFWNTVALAVDLTVNWIDVFNDFSDRSACILRTCNKIVTGRRKFNFWILELSHDCLKFSNEGIESINNFSDFVIWRLSDPAWKICMACSNLSNGVLHVEQRSDEAGNADDSNDRTECNWKDKYDHENFVQSFNRSKIKIIWSRTENKPSAFITNGFITCNHLLFKHMIGKYINSCFSAECFSEDFSQLRFRIKILYVVSLFSFWIWISDGLSGFHIHYTWMNSSTDINAFSYLFDEITIVYACNYTDYFSILHYRNTIEHCVLSRNVIYERITNIIFSRHRDFEICSVWKIDRLTRSFRNICEAIRTIIGKIKISSVAVLRNFHKLCTFLFRRKIFVSHELKAGYIMQWSKFLCVSNVKFICNLISHRDNGLQNGLIQWFTCYLFYKCSLHHCTDSDQTYNNSHKFNLKRNLPFHSQFSMYISIIFQIPGKFQNKYL